MTDTPSRGFFITFEGVEGSGKTTQITRLADWLREQGRTVLVSRDPGGTEIGTKIRGILLDPDNVGICDRTELLLYEADRAQHVVEKIEPALARGEVVLCDRYVHSTLAYQGYGRGIPQADIRWLNDYATRGLMPDLVLLLDLDPVVGLFRATAAGDPDRLEREAMSFHAKVRAGFLVLAAAEPERFVIVAGDEPTDRVTASIREHVAKRCGIVP